jgi:hypothetical protein
MKEGRDVVRIFDKNSLSWQTLPGVKLSEYRWYPTQVRSGALVNRLAARTQDQCVPCSGSANHQEQCKCAAAEKVCSLLITLDALQPAQQQNNSRSA